MYWIKERHNPQFDKPYYVACGQISAKKARSMEKPLYGDNYMHKYATKAKYNQAIIDLKDKGFRVQP